ncbi:hypothetical protein TRFO_30364 [Tritrichomonas foetus]|uniref:Uncharacterized protein n=1 Tax=Tritrichomonas foetus TaxID=1144522 RepID=A0A1J4JVL5_9EUKA|nr:hypothetical protein TRFO_30364 [Tritrichomonas foetus]|eukprot:OHT02480.1 hypothetical protein TRFO_30364 [Tritrichomonas foetus]
MGLDVTIGDAVGSIVEDVKHYLPENLEMHPLIKMIAASEMRNIKSNKVHMQNRKVIDELKNALDFNNDFVNESLEKMEGELMKAFDQIVCDTYKKIFTHQLNKIDLSYLEIDNCLNSFYYGRINADESNKLSDEMINRIKDKTLNLKLTM